MNNNCPSSNQNEFLLFSSYLLFFISMFAFNTEAVSDKLFNYVVIPASLIPLDIFYSEKNTFFRRLHFSFSLNNPAKTLQGTNSYSFMFIFLYIALLAFSSFMTPEPTTSWFKIMFIYFSIPTLLFILITSRLSIAFKNCGFIFYATVSSVVAVNAAINVYVYMSQNDLLTQLHTRGFLPKYGIATGFGTASCALTYTIFLICALATIPHSKSKFYKFYMIIVATILSCALLLTQSRAPLVGLFFALIPLFYRFFINSTQQAKFLITGIVSIFFTTPFILGSPLARRDSYRFEIWSRFLNVIKERPIFGYGERLNLAVVISDGENINHAHNLLYTSILRGGFFSGISLILIFIIALKDSISVCTKYTYLVPICLFLLISTSSIIDYEIMLYSSGWHWATLWFCTSIWLGAEILSKELN